MRLNFHLSTHGQTLMVIPVILAASLGGAIYWNYHSTIMQSQSHVLKGTALDQFAQLIEARIIASVVTPEFNPNTCHSLIQNTRSRLRNFGSTNVDTIKAQIRTNTAASCLFTTEETKKIDSVNISVQPHLARAPFKTAKTTLSIEVKGNGLTYIIEKTLIFKLIQLIDYNWILSLASSSTPIVTSSTAMNLGGSERLKLFVAGDTLEDSHNSPTGPSKLFDPIGTWLTFNGTYTAPRFPSGTFTQGETTAFTTHEYSQVFTGPLRVGQNYVSPPLGKNLEVLRPALNAPRMYQRQPNLCQTPPPSDPPKTYPDSNLPNSHVHLDFSKLPYIPEEQEDPNTLTHCGYVRASRLEVTCPDGKRCILYSLLHTRQLKLHGNGKVIVTNPFQHIGTDEGPEVRYEDTLIRKFAISKIHQSFKDLGPTNQLLLYEPFRSQANPSTILERADDLSPAFGAAVRDQLILTVTEDDS